MGFCCRALHVLSARMEVISVSSFSSRGSGDAGGWRVGRFILGLDVAGIRWDLPKKMGSSLPVYSELAIIARLDGDSSLMESCDGAVLLFTRT